MPWFHVGLCRAVATYVAPTEARAPLLREQLLPPRMPQGIERLHVALDDDVRIREGLHRAVDAGFAQQVQGGVGRPVGVVADVVRHRAGELVVGVEAGHLDDALQVQRLDRGIGIVEEVVVVEEIRQHVRVHDQRGVDLLWIGVAKQHQLFGQFLQQGIEQKLAKKIVSTIKDAKLKVEAQINGDKLRVTGKKRDDLQDVIALLKKTCLLYTSPSPRDS